MCRLLVSSLTRLTWCSGKNATFCTSRVNSNGAFVVFLHCCRNVYLELVRNSFQQFLCWSAKWGIRVWSKSALSDGWSDLSWSFAGSKWENVCAGRSCSIDWQYFERFISFFFGNGTKSKFCKRVVNELLSWITTDVTQIRWVLFDVGHCCL